MLLDYFSRTVAWRGLRFNRSQTLLTMGVVTISVTLIIFLASLIYGLQNRIIENVTGAIAHIEVTPPERVPVAIWEHSPADHGPDEETIVTGERTQIQQRKQTIEGWQPWVERLETLDPNIIGVSPTAQGQGFLSRGEQRESVRIVGVLPERHNRIVPIQSNLVGGRFFGLGSNEIAIGKPLADDFDVDIGDRLRLTSAEGISSSYVIAGIFNTGFGQVDNGTVFLPLRDGQSLLGIGSSVTTLGLKLERIFEAEELAGRMSRQVPFETTSWMEENESVLNALRSQSQSSNLILAFTTIAAGFAIASILVMLVVSKRQEIGILKAMGASRGQIVRVFTLEGTLMAALGGVVGAAVGSGLSYGLSQIQQPDDRVQRFPIELTPEIVLLAFSIAVGAGFLASLFPASRAARIDPIEVIRGA